MESTTWSWCNVLLQSWVLCKKLLGASGTIACWSIGQEHGCMFLQMHECLENASFGSHLVYSKKHGISVDVDVDLANRYEVRHYLSKFADTRSPHRDVCDGDQPPNVTHVVDYIFHLDRSSFSYLQLSSKSASETSSISWSTTTTTTTICWMNWRHSVLSMSASKKTYTSGCSGNMMEYGLLGTKSTKGLLRSWTSLMMVWFPSRLCIVYCLEAIHHP